MALYANKTVILQLDNGSKVTMEKALNYASGLLKDFLATTDSDEKTEELPLQNTPTYQSSVEDFHLLNKFMKFVDENLHDE